jgi:TPR repeat protein
VSEFLASSKKHPRRWRRRGWLAGLLLLGLAVAGVVTLELWPHPTGWLGDLQGLVDSGLRWMRVHWLTSGALGVVVAVLGLWLTLRSERQHTTREQHQQRTIALAEQTRYDAEAQAARSALLAAHCWMPRISEVHDPVMLGVHPAPTLADLPADSGEAANGARQGPLGRVPVYVPRDIDARLDAALAHALANGGLVLLRGDSTAGKSRTAYEAARRLPGELRLLIPTKRDSLRKLLDGGVELCEVVIWLNDLERWLGADGLDVGLLRRLLDKGDRRVLLLATMRASEYNKRSPERDRDHPEPEQDVVRAERELLDQAVDFELPRRFSPTERQRASDRAWDPRIADALEHAGQYGLAEYLAAGPRLWRRWRNARAVDNLDQEQAGAAIVAAALDCRRAGLSRPVPTPLLEKLYQGYMDASVAGRLGPDAFHKGLAWARTPVQATSALLMPGEGGEVVFDYLLDRLQADPDTPMVPPRVWESLLADLRPEDGVNVGVAAHWAGQHSFAERAWQQAADAGLHEAEYNLGVLFFGCGDLQEAEAWYRRAANAADHFAEHNLGFLLVTQGRLEEAERWYQRAADAGLPRAENNLGMLLRDQGRLKEAEVWYRRAVAAGHPPAENNLGMLLRDQGQLEEAEAWYRRAVDGGLPEAEHNLGNLLKDQGRPKEAEAWYRRAANAGIPQAQFSLGILLQDQGRLKEAEAWYRRAANAGLHKAEHYLASVASKQGRLEEAEAWYRRAADAGIPQAAYNLGNLYHRRADLEEAERWWRRAADAGYHPAESNLGTLLYQQGQIEEAEAWCRRAADADDHVAELNLGSLLEDQGKVEEAETWYRRAADAGIKHAIEALVQLRANREDPAQETK